MSFALKGLLNPNWKPGLPPAARALVDPAALAEVELYHRSFPQYAPTPLRSLSGLALHWGVGGLWVKDESPRFGLNAFKVLGASYAVGKILAGRLGRSLDELPFPALQKPQVRSQLGGVVLAATTDGNHGRGVAWTASQLGLPATIFMPKGTVATRLENIRKLGQSAEVTAMNYDDTVRWVASQARDKGWEIVQDTAWDGYVDVPRWIMQGYSTVARETVEQLAGARPTHVFLQAGVGAFAAVMAALLLDAFGADPPRIVVLEAMPAECFYESVRLGRKTAVGGELDTIMAGLACGEPNPLAWDILKDAGFAFLAAPNEAAAHGMRVLGNALPGDEKIVAGESGAVGPGVLGWLTQRPEYAALRDELGLGAGSRVLCFSTEGDTDPAMYRQIAWEGAYRG
jgi:diaminopropionate ammonia-lyase